MNILYLLDTIGKDKMEKSQRYSWDSLWDSAQDGAPETALSGLISGLVMVYGTRWCPSSLANLVYNFHNYGLWMFMVDISIVDGIINQLITRGHHLVDIKLVGAKPHV